jgi:hypothetical protein
MPGTTPTGYHRPIGADPLEPATALTRLTDPTDEGILADSIEAAHARCEVDAVATSITGTDQAIPVGAVTHENVSGFYSKASTTRVAVAEAGRYRVFGRAFKTGTAAAWTVKLEHVDDGLFGGEMDRCNGTAAQGSATTSGEVRLVAGEGFRLVATVSGGDIVHAAEMFIERIGP